MISGLDKRSKMVFGLDQGNRHERSSRKRAFPGSLMRVPRYGKPSKPVG